jgi:hypothetical protein
MQRIIPTFAALLILVIGLAGCEKQADPRATSASDAKARASTVPALQPSLAAWQKGNQAAAVSNFVQADWNSRPLFPVDSRLNMTEEEFRSRVRSLFTPESVNAMGTNLFAELEPIKRLAAAVGQAGQKAAAERDYAKARKYFTALQQCGAALDSTNSLALLQAVGQGLKSRADLELNKLPPESHP